MNFVFVFTLNCFIMSTCGLQHSSMWDLETAAQGAGWATLTFSNSNLDVIKTNFESAGMVALYPLKWTVAQSKLCYAPVTHMQTYADGTFPCVTIDPNYTASWRSQWQEIKPLVDIGAITGIFLGDERMYFGIHLSEVKLIADEIRHTWPQAIIYINEAPDIAMCNMRKDNTSVFKDDECVPVNVDWFGFDFYQTDSVSWTASHEAFNTILYPRFSRTSQRFLPTTMGHFPDASNKTDAFCVRNAIEWTRIALNDPRIVAIFAFGGAFGPMDTSGCSQMFQAMGKTRTPMTIKQSNTTTTTTPTAPSRISSPPTTPTTTPLRYVVGVVGVGVAGTTTNNNTTNTNNDNDTTVPRMKNSTTNNSSSYCTVVGAVLPVCNLLLMIITDYLFCGCCGTFVFFNV